jgi:hypothetical protein
VLEPLGVWVHSPHGRVLEAAGVDAEARAVEAVRSEAFAEMLAGLCIEEAHAAVARARGERVEPAMGVSPAAAMIDR